IGVGYTGLIAGTGTAGYTGDGGPALSAELSDPSMLVTDSAGDVFFIDGSYTSSSRVREIVGATGNIKTVIGSSYVPYATGLAMDSSGNLYIAAGNHPGYNYVYKWALSTGNVTRIAGTGTAGYTGNGGLATSAELDFPQGLAVDSSGNVYIADYANNEVREVSASTGDISAFAGTGTAGYTGNGGSATSAELSEPNGLTIDSSGNLYISDAGNNAIREVNHSSGDISTVAAVPSSGQLAIDSSDDLYIINDVNETVDKVDPSTGSVTSLGNFSFPDGVTVDPSGNIYVALYYNK